MASLRNRRTLWLLTELVRWHHFLAPCMFARPWFVWFPRWLCHLYENLLLQMVYIILPLAFMFSFWSKNSSCNHYVCERTFECVLCEFVFMRSWQHVTIELNVWSLFEGRDKHIKGTLYLQLHSGSGEHSPAAKKLRTGDGSTLGVVNTFVWWIFAKWTGYWCILQHHWPLET